MGGAARLLKKLREGAGLTMEKIADEAGIHKTSYAYYENCFKGDYLPQKPALNKVRGVLSRKGASESDLDLLFGVRPDGELAELRGRLSAIENKLGVALDALGEIRAAVKHKQ
jgi:transcriptional regulator with XRE-family HTH domain